MDEAQVARITFRVFDRDRFDQSAKDVVDGLVCDNDAEKLVEAMLTGKSPAACGFEIVMIEEA